MTIMILVHLIHWLASALFLSLILFGFRFRQTKTGRSLLIFSALSGWWTLIAALIYLAPDLETKIFLNRLKMMGVFWIPLSIFNIATSWHGRWEPTPFVKYVLAFVPLVFTVLVVTGYHENIITGYALMYSDYDASPLIFKNGKWYHFFNIYARLVVLGALALVMHGATQLNKNLRGQSYLIAFSIFVPFLADSVAVFFIQELRYAQVTPTVLALSAFVIGFIVYRHRGLELIPMGHSWVVDSLKEAYFLFDKVGRLVDYNPRAQDLFSVGKNDLGHLTQEVFSENKKIQEIFEKYKESPPSEFEIEWQDSFYQVNFKRLQQKNGKFMGWLLVFSDITRSKLVEADLLELNEMKNKFFGIMAHDLVGHIRALSLTSQVLKERYQSMSPEAVREASDLIYKSSEAMNQFVQELLTWSKTQIHSLVMQKKTFAAKEWVQGVFTFLEPIATAKKVQLQQSISRDLVLYGDLNMLSTVLRNLVENAIKNSPENGMLQVDIEHKEEKTVVSVINQGQATGDDLAVDFFKIGNLSFRFPPDQGLGLYLCQDFVTRHHGEIWATALPGGKGMVFSFSLPQS